MRSKSLLGVFSKSILISPSMVKLALMVFFFLSGVSCLLYQLVWQRLLYQIFGVDLASMTIIISVFMLGFGMGGLIGGWLADRYSQHLLMLYVFVELCIALFGYSSPKCMGFVELYFMTPYLWTTACGSFLLLLLPTLLMGMTFPILVLHIHQQHNNIGGATGLLYFFNTLGGAVGVYFGGFVLLSTITLSQILFNTATLNLLIAISVFLLFRQQQT